jgi:hypothetical protein
MWVFLTTNNIHPKYARVIRQKPIPGNVNSFVVSRFDFVRLRMPITNATRAKGVPSKAHCILVGLLYVENMYKMIQSMTIDVYVR